MSISSGIRVRARLATPPDYVLAKFPEYVKAFYRAYADFILSLIGTDAVRELLGSLISAEGIRSDRLIDLRVMIFPARQLKSRPSRILYGSYSQSLAQISLYPLRVSKERIRVERGNLFETPLTELSRAQKKLISEMATAAISTLIHEVLHVKFQQRNLARYVEEGMVKRLEKTYMSQWSAKLDELLESQMTPHLTSIS